MKLDSMETNTIFIVLVLTQKQAKMIHRSVLKMMKLFWRMIMVGTKFIMSFESSIFNLHALFDWFWYNKMQQQGLEGSLDYQNFTSTRIDLEAKSVR